MRMHGRSTSLAGSNGALPFEVNASIVLVGARGTGKSSLAVIAQSYFDVKPIDVVDYLRLTQPSNGTPDTTRQLEEILATSAAVQRYLRVTDASKVKRLLELGNRIYRACSNFEFHNMDENDVATIAEPEMPSLRLKRLEMAFVQFAGNISGRRRPNPRDDGLLLPPSRSPLTYLLSLPLEHINRADFQVRWLNCGADVCQLVIDAAEANDSLMDDIGRAVAILVRFFDGPLVYHVKLPNSQTEHESYQRYVNLLNHGIRLGVDYMTISLNIPEDQLSQIVAAAGQTLLIGAFHDDTPGFDGWSKEERWAMYNKAKYVGIAGVRLTQEAQDAHDNLAAVSFAVEATRSPAPRPFLSAYNQGILGRPSQHLNQVLMPVTVDGLGGNGLPPAGAELTIRGSQSAQFALSVWEPMKFSIIGVDVTYSLSPSVHTAGYEFFGMPHSFERWPMSSLDRMHQLVQEPYLGGISIAQGYKLTVSPFVRALSTHARNIGAINTLIPMRAGADFDGTETAPSAFWRDRCRPGPIIGLYGENTDWIGMARCVLPNLSPANAITAKTTALVIGAGGMARAALYALLQMGVRYVAIYNRTISKASMLAQHFGGLEPSHKLVGPNLDLFGARAGPVPRADDDGHACNNPRFQVRVLESRDCPWYVDLAPPTIVISCVPASRVGSQPGANVTLPTSWMRSPTGGVVLDLNYRPIMTALLRQVRHPAHRDRGWVPVDGLENLAAQASAQFELFTGRHLPRGLMHVAALRDYEALGDDDEEAREVVRAKLAQCQGQM
ncbi:hypothetical protein ACO1O0_003753 [Amphichorda felina]